jgi:amino acid transporter
MAQETKFGTFGGVFTPSILTILGVIMYLRLPWVVGNGGLYTALGIIAVAHLVSVCTGLSISSIATDKKVGAGGPYYIVSRSLGLPIGGTLGLALFIGLAFSISLYVIGFSESFLSYWKIDVNATTIRICGTIVLLALTAVTLISTALAIKTQYLILGLIVASLFSVFLGGHPQAPATIITAPAEGGASAAVIFGIYFPAVTGFTAGVNMSGDLKDPRKAIPSGTIAAILVGLVVYTALAWFLAAKVPREALMNDSEILLKVAVYAPAVVAGIWGATLSSALGSILGAPRILQAVSGDRILPRFLAKGYGPGNEPRNALVVSFFIAEAGILIAELDAIARIVSMVFLATYGFLNISCAIESWVSPDFRPSFKIPRTVSLVGAATCALLMIQLDLLAMLGSVTLLAALFLVLSRKQLTLDAGDAWEGVWSSLVRSGLWRLSRSKRQQRNWRPNILAFRPAGDELRDQLRGVAATFIVGNGVLTDIELSDEEPHDDADQDDPDMGVFYEHIPAGDVYDTIAYVTRYHGHAGLSPNTVLLEWNAFRKDNERFGELLDQITQLDKNLLVWAAGNGGDDDGARIDVWWSPEAGNVGLSTGLLRFITRSRHLSDADLRFLLVSNDSTANDHLRATMRGVLTDARVDASIRIINNTLKSASLHEHVARESADARLCIMGLPADVDDCGPNWQRSVDKLLDSLGRTLMVRGSSSFEEVLRLSRQATISFIPPSETPGKAAELPILELPETPEIANAVSKLASGYQRLVSRFHKACVQRVYGTNVKLLRRIEQAVEKQFAVLDKGLSGANPRRLRNLVNRTQSTLLKEFGAQLERFDEKQLEAQRTLLESRIRAFFDSKLVRSKQDADDEQLLIRRAARDLEPDDDDDDDLRRFKARKVFFAKLLRRPVRYRAPLGRLRDFYFEQAVDELLDNTVQQFAIDSHNLMVHLGKLLSSVSFDKLLTISKDMPSEEEIRPLLEAQRDNLLRALRDLIDHNKERIGRTQWALLAGSRKLAQRLAEDLSRLDVRNLVRRERRPDPKGLARERERLEGFPHQWFAHQRLILERARLGLRLATFQHRLASIVERDKQAIVLNVNSGALGECKRVLTDLRRLADQLTAHEQDDATPLIIAFDPRADFEQRVDVEQVIDTLVSSTADLAGELPQHVTTLSDEAIKKLEEGQTEDIESVEVPVQRLAQFLIEARFVGAVQEALEKVPRLEARAAGVAQDAMRLVSFQLSETNSGDGDAAASLTAQLGPVVTSGVERLEAEIDALHKALEAVTTTIDTQLELVLDGTNPYDLTRTSADLDQHIRRHHGERAAAGARSLFRRGSERVSEAMVSLVYRRSRGLLLARERRQETSAADGKVVDKMLDLVEAHMPKPDVLEELPSYYRQLFYGQATINETFWVGRHRQIAAAKRAIASFDRGKVGALVVVGERGSGKTSLVQRITSELLGRRPIHRVMPPRHGTTHPAALTEALQNATRVDGTDEELLGHLGDGTVIVIDDLELWWERSESGFGVVDRVAELVERFGDRILFVVAMSSQAFSFINRFRALGDDALAVLECTPVPAEDLQSIVMLRHGSTGLKFVLGGKEEAELSDLRMARLFSKHFDYSGGQVGAALRSWVTHVRKVGSGALDVVTPSPSRWELLDELRPSLKAILVQLVLHKSLSRARLLDVTGAEPTSLDHELDTLVRMGLVNESQRHALAINPFVHHAVIRRLNQRGLLA